MSSPLPKFVRGFEKNRLEALADGIFAVALTLLVLDIKLPDEVEFTSNDALWARLVELERHFAVYVISFIVIAMYWVSHQLQFHFVRYTDRRLIWINMFWLLLISFLPFATDLMGDHKQLVLPCEIYGVTLISISAVSFMHLEYMMHHPYLTTREFTHDIAVMLKHRILWFTLIPVASMIAAFYSTHAAVYMYMMLVFAHFLTSRIDERIHCEPPSPPDAAPRE